MESPEKIPLNEAVDRGLIPCTVCGAKGAAVRAVSGKRHFLCASCAGKPRRLLWLAAGIAVAAIAAGIAFWFLKDEKPKPPVLSGPEMYERMVASLLKAGKFKEARESLRELLEVQPRDPVLNARMGECLQSLGYHEVAVPYWRAAAEADPGDTRHHRLWLGLSLKQMGRPAGALEALERPFADAVAERGRKVLLAEIRYDLERYEEALAVSSEEPLHGDFLWARHWSLVRLGRLDEADRALGGVGESTANLWRAQRLKEDGKFAEAAKLLEALEPGREKGSRAWTSLQREKVFLFLEAGQGDRADAAIADLIGAGRPEGLWFRAVRELLEGRRDGARAAAWEFLAKADPELTSLRVERLMMKACVGELGVKEIEAEAQATSRYWANDLYWFMAILTGDRALAQKAADATPSRNFPYHSIRRLLDK